MKSYVAIEGNSSLARDPNSGTIVNINKDEISKARLLKTKRKEQEREFDDLKNEVSEVKELLNKLIEKL
jgi:tetrahydromethanopterin S-methyltransferase subunit B|tara:strand:- start:6080 stop:6286 length:207 start_codon:yes stop_codon:yes gene_type:complete